MNMPKMLEATRVAEDTWQLPAYMPVPGLGVLPVNAFLVRGAEPVLVDTGMPPVRDDFMRTLRALVPLEEIRWIWLTHTDADHTGALEQVLAEAPRARVVTTYLGMGKMAVAGRPLPAERVHLLNPGQSLALADRALVAFRPPTFDAPETTALLDARTRALFSSDCFGANLPAPAAAAAELAPATLREGVINWATIDSPWLHAVEERSLAAALDDVRRLDPEVVLSAHLPPARGLLEALAAHLAAARTATPFVGPDQAALLGMLGAA
jgi:flavorubredoxin